MKTLKIVFALFFAICLTSCYDEFVADYEYSACGFSMEKPLRTTIADRDYKIYIGVSIGGKRAVDMKDWATFEIVSDYVVPAGYQLLPQNYYVLDDPNTFRVRKSNLPVADVGMKFTEDFYNDPKTVGKYYLLPLRITGSSLDSVYRAETVIAFKYISTFHGSYYVKGTMEELNAAGEVIATTVYNDKDLIKNPVRDIQTVGRNVIVRPGLANANPTGNEKVQLTIETDGNANKTYNVLVGQASGGISITDGSGTYYGNRTQPEIEIKYSFVRGTRRYRVSETMVLRQDPEKDFRVESW